jgi:hypothetical protein
MEKGRDLNAGWQRTQIRMMKFSTKEISALVGGDLRAGRCDGDVKTGGYMEIAAKGRWRAQRWREKFQSEIWSLRFIT